MTQSGLGLIKGTVDLLVLRAVLDEPRHGYAISEWIAGATDGDLLVEEGTLYPALHRLEEKGWLEAEWGLSENNRRARYYRLTKQGGRQLEGEVRAWRRYADAVARALAPEGSAS